MRFSTLLLMVTLALTACDMGETTSSGPVDVNTLAPLTSKEQSLIYGADGAMAQGNTAAAERDYMSAIAISNGHTEAHIALARLYDKQHQNAKEAAILDRALILQPNNPLANYMRGKIYLDTYHYDEAHAAFDRGLKTHPDDLDLNTGKGIAYDMLGKHTAAQSTYLRAIQVNQKSNLTSVKTNLAMSYMLSGQPKKAVEVLQPEVRKPGVSSVTRQNLALAYGILGRNADAKKLLNGEIDEETRTLAVARMREYVRDTGNDIHTPPFKSSIMPAPATADSMDAPRKVVPASLKTDRSPLAKAITAKEAADAKAAREAAAAKAQ